MHDKNGRREQEMQHCGGVYKVEVRRRESIALTAIK